MVELMVTVAIELMPHAYMHASHVTLSMGDMMVLTFVLLYRLYASGQVSHALCLVEPGT